MIFMVEPGFIKQWLNMRIELENEEEKKYVKLMNRITMF